MPSDRSGWRSTADYDYVERLGASDLAWEWLRRNKHYAKDYATLSKAAPDDASLKQALLDKWGLRFRGRSKASSSKGLRALGPPARSVGGRVAEGSGSPEQRGLTDDPAHRDNQKRPRRPPPSS
ncbi:transcriptional regulator domain-containing protein [Primorskyibacter flagellatus]|uniref:transcriptional regulator domain-containing protein n=1 Tax=Primorskyibacter flagellatus TaxID=1387277 RepID=UPI003A8FF479